MKTIEWDAEAAEKAGFEHLGVDDDLFRLVKRADDVLYAAEVYRRLSADGRIDLRQERGRDIVKIHAAHIAGCGKAAQVAGDTSADGDDAVASRK